MPTSIPYADQRTISCDSCDLSCARCQNSRPSICFVLLGLLQFCHVRRSGRLDPATQAVQNAAARLVTGTQIDQSIKLTIL